MLDERHRTPKTGAGRQAEPVEIEQEQAEATARP